MCMLRPRCGLCMLHRTCEIVYGGVRLGVLSMPNGGCTLCMPVILSPNQNY